MNISIFTQDEDFFLKENFENFIKRLPKDIKLKAIFLCSVSPYGKKLSLISKLFKSLSTFGIKFTLRYSFKFLISKYLKENMKKMFLRNNIDVFYIKNKIGKKDIEKIKKLNLDLIISLACPVLFKEEILNIPKKGCINIHCSLLPKYRGLMPSFWTLYNNEDYSGVSIFLINKDIDDGPIIFQKKIKVSNFTLEELILNTKAISFKALRIVLKLFKKNKIKIINENNVKESTYFSFPNKKDVDKFRLYNKLY